MVGRLVEMARIGMWAIPWIGGLGAVMALRRERRPAREPEPVDCSGMGLLILAHQATCWTPGPALPGVAPTRRRDRSR